MLAKKHFKIKFKVMKELIKFSKLLQLILNVQVFYIKGQRFNQTVLAYRKLLTVIVIHVITGKSLSLRFVRLRLFLIDTFALRICTKKANSRSLYDDN